MCSVKYLAITSVDCIGLIYGGKDFIPTVEIYRIATRNWERDYLRLCSGNIEMNL